MIKNFIFDVDGTLLDSMPIFCNSLAAALEKNGISIDEPFEKYMGYTAEQTLEKLNIQNKDEVMVDWCLFFNRLSFPVVLYEGIAEAIKSLYEKGIKIAIATSRSHYVLDEFVKRSGIGDYISVCIATEDTKHHKPHPEPVLLAMERLNALPEETVYVGDSPGDYTAAEGARVKFFAAGWNPAAKDIPGEHLKTPSELLDITQLRK